MALILLIVLGLSAGWLASIIARTEDAGAILRQMGVGLVGSVAAGLIMNSGTILGSLSLLALGCAIAASVALLVVYHGITGRSAEA